jgi:hypothetical protein
MSKLINVDSETFIKGPYKGDSIYDVADEYPEYLRRILDNELGDREDRELLEPLVRLEN